MKTTAIYHSADYDGIFCREIARKFLPDAELIGWNFGEPKIATQQGAQVYVLDLPPECLDWAVPGHAGMRELIWIDHHKSSIEKWAHDIPGYRIDGVAACRLAWQWFQSELGKKWFPGASCPLPNKQDFLDRKVAEPLAVRLAGEYDVWDHRGDGDLEFQFGLDAWPQLPWDDLLTPSGVGQDQTVNHIVSLGKAAMACYAKRDADIMRERSFLREWEGLQFLCLNTARCNSNTFAARDIPETGHDALMGFYFNGKVWTVSMYHAQHRKDIDLSLLAVKHGGGGHRGACGFTTKDWWL